MHCVRHMSATQWLLHGCLPSSSCICSTRRVGKLDSDCNGGSSLAQMAGRLAMWPQHTSHSSAACRTPECAMSAVRQQRLYMLASRLPAPRSINVETSDAASQLDLWPNISRSRH